MIYKFFSVTLKFEVNFFRGQDIIIEKATHDNPMVIAVLLQISHHISGFQQKVKYCPV